MSFILALAISSLLTGPASMDQGQVTVGSSSSTFSWQCPELEEYSHLPRGLTGFTAPGCGCQGDVLLPRRTLVLAIPPGSEPRLRVTPHGVERLGPLIPASVAVSDEGIDIYSATDITSDNWGRIVETGVFRRAGYAVLELDPVITSDGGLLRAQRLDVTLEYPASPTVPAAAGGVSGRVFDAFFHGGNLVWLKDPAERASSPFWGLPWYAMDVDTSGIYRVSGSDVPDAVGMPSSTLALFCGRGREMGEEPWLDPHEPRPVPILVQDGGDGVFDSEDSFVFFGRGLAWWEPDSGLRPDHFNHRFAESNVYWLTWGGEDGARMGIQNGEITGASSLPDSVLFRMHLEENQEYTFGITAFPDDWGWIRSTGSVTTTSYINFDAPGALGGGTLRMSVQSVNTGRHQIRLMVNSDPVCDTTWSGTSLTLIDTSIQGLLSSGNSLSIEIVRDGPDDMYIDWIQLFPWRSNSFYGQTMVPLAREELLFRRRLDWNDDLSDAMAFLVFGDTLAENIQLPGGSSFEFQKPSEWSSADIWLTRVSDMPIPDNIRKRSPGRIVASGEGSESIYVCAGEFQNDIEPLVQNSTGSSSYSTQEVYDEFNCGVRDPRAINLMADHTVMNWDPVPENLILVGTGTWDPRNFLYSAPSYIDVLYIPGTDFVSDDRFVIVQGSNFPQIAVSRMAVSSRSDLQRIVSRTLEYAGGENSGQWQTVVLGAADDERSPIISSDERYHTQGVERLLTQHVPSIIRPEKLYLILYEWNSIWTKPEGRQAYIDLWSQGALISVYLGHGSFDQLADEGLLYLEDNGLLACQGRLPLALYGSCDVGRFQSPSSECIGQQVTVSPVGGAIASLAATDKTSGPVNELMMGAIMDRLFSHQHLSMGMCMLLGKIDAGYSTNAGQYVNFGDGSLSLAFPWNSFQLNADTLRSGEMNPVTGSAPSDGLVMVEAFESCRPDTYYTFRQTLPIEYLSMPSLFYSGSFTAGPDFSGDIFVPVDSDTGNLARTQLVYLSHGVTAAATNFPAPLIRGVPGQDTQGPEIELWIEGSRYMTQPEVSGDVVVRALLSDSSGINLLGNIGRQLALYVDGTPQNVSEFFRYRRGSATTGELTVDIGTLEAGEHELILRASDGLLNISQDEMTFSVTRDNEFSIFNVFPYPNPCSGGTSINWDQSAQGRVDISIYTVAGRRIAFFGNIEAEAGYNQCWWNCRDADGDEVASGSYIFRIAAASRAGSGESSEACGVIAVVRDLE